MGTCAVPIEVGDTSGTRWETVDALVDTGATYSSLSSDVLERLGVTDGLAEEFVTADGRVIERPVGEVRCRLDGRQRHTLAVFADPGSPALLAALALEQFGLAVDPFARRLVRRRG